MKKKALTALTGVLMIVGLCGLSQATSYNAAGDFSLTSNPNGVWSYGYGYVSGSVSTNDLQLASFTQYGYTITTSDFSQWYIPETDYSVPNIGNNYHSYDVYGIKPGHLTMHPGASSVATILSFTAPISGSYTIDADFLEGDSGSMLLAIFQGLTATALYTGTDSASYDFTVSLLAGQTLYFVVYAPSGDEGYFCGNTGLDLTISDAFTSVPEPTGLLLFGIGLMALAGIRRKFSK